MVLPPSTTSSAPVVLRAWAAKEGEHIDVAHPITQEAREYIQEEILKVYQSLEG